MKAKHNREETQKKASGLKGISYIGSPNGICEVKTYMEEDEVKLSWGFLSEATYLSLVVEGEMGHRHKLHRKS